MIAKDVLEHIPTKQVGNVIYNIDDYATKGILIVVPLADETGKKYARDEDNMDKTHEIIWSLDTWVELVSNLTYGDVYSSYCIRGIKPAAEAVEKSTGFILVKK